MRKLILSLLFSGIGLYAMGQGAAPTHQLIPLTPSELAGAKKILPRNPNVAGSTNTSVPISQWYDAISESQSTGAESYTVYNNTVFADSSVQSLYGDGAGGTKLFYVGTQGEGEVFDPKAPVYDSALSLYNTYKVDSVALFYQYHYVPEKDSLSPDGLVHDTLIFQFYTIKTGGIATGTFTQTTPNEPWAVTRYDYKHNIGTNTYSGIKVTKVLGQADTALTTHVITVATNGANGIPVNYVLNTKPKTGYNTDLFAFTVSYRPGFKYKFGDTIDEKSTPTPIHLHSHFKTLEGHSAKDALTNYEMSLTLVSSVRYNTNTNGWNGQYIPGTAWIGNATNPGYNEVLYSAFYVESPNDAAINQTPGDPKGYILGNVYPNPANGTAKLDFALGNTEQVKITLYDMLGHEIAVLANGQYTSGTHSIAFNTDNLKEGVYLYSINAGSFAKTLKFTVAHN